MMQFYLTSIFQLGWNHQPALYLTFQYFVYPCLCFLQIFCVCLCLTLEALLAWNLYRWLDRRLLQLVCAFWPWLVYITHLEILEVGWIVQKMSLDRASWSCYRCYPCSGLHPGRLTWNLPIPHLERKMIFQTSMIMFHVNLQGCKQSPRIPLCSFHWI